MAEDAMSKKRVKDNTFGYVIALITLGAAFGNMFLGGGMKSFLKLKLPSMNQFSRKTAQYSKTAGEKKAEDSAHTQQPRVKDNKAQSTFASAINPLYPFPSEIVVELRKLDISADEMAKVTVAENLARVKESYRELAMLYHPDRIPKDDIRRVAHERKFKEISISHSKLTEYLSQVTGCT